MWFEAAIHTAILKMKFKIFIVQFELNFSCKSDMLETCSASIPQIGQTLYHLQATVITGLAVRSIARAWSAGVLAFFSTIQHIILGLPRTVILYGN